MLRYSLAGSVALGIVGLLYGAAGTHDDPDEVSIECFDSSGKYLRHKNAITFVERIVSVQDSKDARFKKVRGLADPKGVSFESYNYPGQYLRHKEGRLVLAKCPEEADKKAATFLIVKGLAFDRDGWVSLEVFAQPGQFVRHWKGGGWVGEKKEDEPYLKSATFRLVNPVPAQR